MALFFEKFPSWIFTINVLNLLLEICRETFRYRTNDPQSISENFSINYNFMSIIIFNEKIISKFTFENQFKIWEGIYNYFKKDPKPIKDSIDFQKIINLLRFYDRNRYDKYCCKKHASLLRSNDENEIVQPDMNSRLGKLLDIIQLPNYNIPEKGSEVPVNQYVYIFISSMKIIYDSMLNCYENDFIAKIFQPAIVKFFDKFEYFIFHGKVIQEEKCLKQFRKDMTFLKKNLNFINIFDYSDIKLRIDNINKKVLPEHLLKAKKKQDEK